MNSNLVRVKEFCCEGNEDYVFNNRAKKFCIGGKEIVAITEAQASCLRSDVILSRISTKDKDAGWLTVNATDWQPIDCQIVILKDDESFKESILACLGKSPTELAGKINLAEDDLASMSETFFEHLLKGSHEDPM